MGNITVYARKDVQDYAEWLASIMEVSRSDVINDVFKHMMDEDLEEDIWGDRFTGAKEEWDSMVEGAEEESEEESEEEASEEEAEE